MIAALLAGCGRSKPATEPAPPSPPVTAPTPDPAPAPDPKPLPTPAPATAGDDLRSESSRRTLKLDELRTRLEAYLNAPGPSPARERLSTLLSGWGVRGRDDGRIATVPFVEADLNGDGRPELVTALNVWGEWKGTPSGAAFVISGREGSYRVDRSPTPPEAYVDGVALVGARDLTGDDLPEIVWVAMDHGAHTGSARVLVSRWAPGTLENLPGDMWTTFAKLEFDGQEILLTGGTVGSAGAGLTQRAATSRYRWTNGSFTVADRRFTPSDWGYHRLIDGINAESFGRTADAEAFYRDVLEPGRPALPLEHLPPESREAFGHAVTAFARFRLGILLVQRGEGAPEGPDGPYAGLTRTIVTGGCKGAETWGSANPGFFEALNAPYGYQNYNWTPADLCSTQLPNMK